MKSRLKKSANIPTKEQAMKCTICGKQIKLVPSAEERAKKGFGTVQYYRSLFTTHTECALKKRADETLELIKKRG